MKAQKYIKIYIDYEMSLLDVIEELQDLANKYPDLDVCQFAELVFRTPEDKKEVK